MLTEQRRQQLDSIVKQMTANKESDANIQLVVNDFKQKYANESPAPKTETPAAPEGLGTKIWNGTKAVGNFLTASEQKFGKSIADSLPAFVPGSAAWTNKQNETIQASRQQQMDSMLAKRKEMKAAGQDTTRLDAVIQDFQKQISTPAIDINETNASVNKSAKQIFGEGLGVAADILSAGSYGNAAKGAQTGKLLVAGKTSGAVGKVLGKAGIESTIAPAAGALPSVIGGGTKASAFIKGAFKGAKQGATSGLLVGSAQGATRAMQEDKSNGEVFSGAVTGGLGGAVAGGVIGGIVGGTGGYLNRRREINKMLEPAMVPDETTTQLRSEIASHADETSFKNAIQKGDLSIDQVYQKNGSINPELAKGRIDDIAANLDMKIPGAGEKYKTLIDPNKTTFEELISKADDVIDESKKIPADVIKFSVDANGNKVVDQQAHEALKAGIADQDIAFIKNSSPEDRKIFDRAMKVAEQASKDKTYSKQPIEEAGKVLVDQVKTINKARQQVGAELGALRGKLANTPVNLGETTTNFMKDLTEAGVQVGQDGSLDFSASKYANVPDIQKALSSAYQRVNALGDAPTAKMADTIRQQLGTEVDLASMSGTMDKSAKRIFQRLYGGLGDNITLIDPKYAELSQKYSSLNGAMEDFQRVLGKDFKATDLNSSLRAGEVGRRILGNASARPLAIVQTIQDLARANGYNKGVDARSQFLFANFLEDLFGTSQAQNLQSQVTKGVNNAQEAAGAVTDVATGNASGLVSKALRKGINLVRNVTPERQIQAVKGLIAR